MLKLLMDIFESASKDSTKNIPTKTNKRPRGRPKGSRNKTTINKLFDINYVLAHLK
jgi:hypothetical protein